MKDSVVQISSVEIVESVLNEILQYIDVDDNITEVNAISFASTIIDETIKKVTSIHYDDTPDIMVCTAFLSPGQVENSQLHNKYKELSTTHMSKQQTHLENSKLSIDELLAKDVDVIVQDSLDVVEILRKLICQVEFFQHCITSVVKATCNIKNNTDLTSSSQPAKLRNKKYEHVISSSFPSTVAQVKLNFTDEKDSQFIQYQSFCTEIQLAMEDPVEEIGSANECCIFFSHQHSSGESTASYPICSEGTQKKGDNFSVASQKDVVMSASSNDFDEARLCENSAWLPHINAPSSHCLSFSGSYDTICDTGVRANVTHTKVCKNTLISDLPVHRIECPFDQNCPGIEDENSDQYLATAANAPGMECDILPENTLNLLTNLTKNIVEDESKQENNAPSAHLPLSTVDINLHDTGFSKGVCNIDELKQLDHVHINFGSIPLGTIRKTSETSCVIQEKFHAQSRNSSPSQSQMSFQNSHFNACEPNEETVIDSVSENFQVDFVSCGHAISSHTMSECKLPVSYKNEETNLVKVCEGKLQETLLPDVNMHISMSDSKVGIHNVMSSLISTHGPQNHQGRELSAQASTIKTSVTADNSNKSSTFSSSNNNGFGSCNISVAKNMLVYSTSNADCTSETCHIQTTDLLPRKHQTSTDDNYHIFNISDKSTKCLAVPDNYPETMVVQKRDLIPDISNHASWHQFVNEPILPLPTSTSVENGNMKFLPSNDFSQHNVVDSGDNINDDPTQDAIVPGNSVALHWEASHPEMAISTNSSQSELFGDSIFVPDTDELKDSEQCLREKVFLSSTPQHQHFTSKLDCEQGQNAEIANYNSASQGSAPSTAYPLVNTASGQLIMRCPTVKDEGMKKVIDWKPLVWKKSGEGLGLSDSVQTVMLDRLLPDNNVAKESKKAKGCTGNISLPCQQTSAEAGYIDECLQVSYKEEKNSNYCSTCKSEEKIASVESQAAHHAMLPHLTAEKRKTVKSLEHSSVADKTGRHPSNLIILSKLGDTTQLKLEELYATVSPVTDYSKSHSNVTSLFDSNEGVTPVKKFTFSEAFGSVETYYKPSECKNYNVNCNERQVVPTGPKDSRKSNRIWYDPSLLAPFVDQEVPAVKQISNCQEEARMFQNESEQTMSNEVTLSSKEDEQIAPENTLEEEEEFNSHKLNNPYAQTNQIYNLDRLYPITPLKTCNRPRRVGLSRHRRVPSLHQNYKPY